MLGILGGMGPLATLDLAQKVLSNTAATRDQEHIQMLILSASNIPDRTAAIVEGAESPLPSMIDAVRRLEAGGATHIAIACNTAHHWYGDLQDAVHTPIIHVVDCVAEAILERAGARPKAGLLATSGTIVSGFFQERLSRSGVETVVPSAPDQREIMGAIREVKAGNLDRAGATLFRQAIAMLENGCAVVIGGCTEIPIALAGYHAALGCRFVDPTELLARKCVEVMSKQGSWA